LNRITDYDSRSKEIFFSFRTGRNWKIGINSAERNLEEIALISDAGTTRFPFADTAIASSRTVSLANETVVKVYGSAPGLTLIEPTLAIQGWASKLGLAEAAVKPELVDGRIWLATESGLFQLDNPNSGFRSCRPQGFLVGSSYCCRIENSP